MAGKTPGVVEDWAQSVGPEDPHDRDRFVWVARAAAGQLQRPGESREAERHAQWRRLFQIALIVVWAVAVAPRLAPGRYAGASTPDPEWLLGWEYGLAILAALMQLVNLVLWWRSGRRRHDMTAVIAGLQIGFAGFVAVGMWNTDAPADVDTASFLLSPILAAATAAAVILVHVFSPPEVDLEFDPDELSRTAHRFLVRDVRAAAKTLTERTLIRADPDELAHEVFTELGLVVEDEP